ncbi:MAG TPA: DegT/DnrJ/EryC1/StrS aminotransferase family protein, partial [Tissierellia bacterium]|nr:DegT/DnrJ/EryC1/StrS aminotransferase family protein [Tissierellia bacterium]
IGGVIEDIAAIRQLVEQKRPIFKASGRYQEALGRVLILSDAAHSFGAKRDDQTSGSIADFTSFSFHAVKNLTTAEGGAVTWRALDGIDDEAIYQELMLLALHGQSKDALAKTKPGMWEYDIVFPGYKCNMTDINASLGLSQLRRYPEMLQRRRELVDRYEAGLKDLPVT